MDVEQTVEPRRPTRKLSSKRRTPSKQRSKPPASRRSRATQAQAEGALMLPPSPTGRVKVPKIPQAPLVPSFSTGATNRAYERFLDRSLKNYAGSD